MIAPIAPFNPQAVTTASVGPPAAGPPVAFAEPPAGPLPVLGRDAVTPADTRIGMDMEPTGYPVRVIPEIPPDPPPVEGLDVPALDTREVGDDDAARGEPLGAILRLLGDTEGTPPPSLDLRI